MIRGIITTRDVLLHPALIVRDFGWRVMCRCALAIVTLRRTTFLALVAG